MQTIQLSHMGGDKSNFSQFHICVQPKYDGLLSVLLSMVCYDVDAPYYLKHKIFTLTPITGKDIVDHQLHAVYTYFPKYNKVLLV